MKKSNLIELLSTFSPAEIKSLGDFVKSPYFNKNPKVTELYGILKKNYPEFDKGKIKKEKIFSIIYPGEKFKDSTLRLLMFYLYDCSKKFIQVKTFFSDKPNANHYLIHNFIDRGLLKEAERTINENNKIFDAVRYEHEDNFWNKYLNGMELLSCREHQYPGRYEKYLKGDVMNELSLNLTDNYLLRLLRLYTIALHINAMFKSNFDSYYYGNIINSFKQEYFEDKPILKVYYLAAKMLEEPAIEQRFYDFKMAFFANEERLDANTRIDLYINLENYCVRQGREGKKKFDRELLDIYKMEIKKKIYKLNGYMGHYFYKSVCITAMLVNEMDWAENFLEDYKKELLPEFREPVYYHCYARIYLYRKDFNKALEYLSKVKTDEIYLKTETRLLFAVVYYELGIEDSLHYLLDTMRHFFRNDRYLAPDRNEFYALFVRLLNKLNLIRQKSSLSELPELKSRIAGTERLFLKNWLIEKIAEIEIK